MRQTHFATSIEDVERGWHIVDATGKRLGRLAADVAQVLMGKHRPEYTAHIDTGEFVIITNAEKIVMTGNKARHRVLTRYSGYPGGLKTETYESLLERKPEFVIENSIRRMMPKGMLGKRMLRKLKVYRGPTHPHAAQQPRPLRAG